MNLPQIETIADLISDLARAGKMFRSADGVREFGIEYSSMRLSEVEEDIRMQVELLVREIK